MSSSFIKDCADSSGTSSARGNKTFIIFVNDATSAPPIEGQDFQNLLVNHGADPSNVSVLQMGQPSSELDFNLPQLSGIEGLGNVAPQPIEQQSNYMMDNFGADAGYAELPIDEDAIKKLESVLHTQEAKDILGDALLDIVNNPLGVHLQDEFFPDESQNTEESSSDRKIKSPKRRSQRQMDKAEREEVEKILAENQLMLKKEREELRKAELEKETVEMKEELEDKINIDIVCPKEELPEPAKVKVKSKNATTSSMGKTLLHKAKGKLKKSENAAIIVEASAKKGECNIKNGNSLKKIKVEDTDENLKLLKGVLKEVSVNLEKLQLKNLPDDTKTDEFDSVTVSANSNEDDNHKDRISPVKAENDCQKEQKILVIKRGAKMENGQSSASLSVQNVSPDVIHKLKKITSSKESPKLKTKSQDAQKEKKIVSQLKLNKKSSKELSLNSPNKQKSKNASLCPPISKSLMNFKIPHKNANKTFYTSSYKKDKNSVKSVAGQNSLTKKEANPKKAHKQVDKSKETISTKNPIKDSPKLSSPKITLEKSVSLPDTKIEPTNPKARQINVKSSTVKKQRPSFENALNSSKEIKSVKVQKHIERSTSLTKESNLLKSVANKSLPTQDLSTKTVNPSPIKSSKPLSTKLLPIKTTTVRIKKKPSIEGKDVRKVETKQLHEMRNPNCSKEPKVDISPLRKSKRPAKKKELDEEFVAPNADSSDVETDDTISDEDEKIESRIESDGRLDSSRYDYDDPNKLWCICQKPHNHRFMICCDSCEDWFHGSCVGITKSMGAVMEMNEKEWTCPRCNPENDNEQPKRKKSNLKKWSEDPHTTDHDPAEARVLVYNTSTGRVLSGNAAPTLSMLEKWLERHKSFSPLLPSMMSSIITDPDTGFKSIKLGESVDEPISPQEKSPGRIFKKMEESKDAKVNNSTDDTITIKDSKYDYDPEFRPMKTPKKAILIDSIHPEHLSKSLNSNKEHQKLEKRYQNKKKPEKKVDSHEKKKTEKRDDAARRVSLTDTYVAKKLPFEEKSPKLNIRNNVKKMFFDALLFRKTQVAEEFTELTTLQIEDLCSKIEEELFNTFNRDVGFKYKSRYRSLIFNIKDSKNGGLYRQILSGTVCPSKLSKMTSDELASKELAEWRHRAEKKELEAIQKHELEMLTMKTHFVMKTHKGEIEIDTEAFKKNKEIAVEVKLPEAVSIEEKEEESPEEINHKSHIYDRLCSICIKMDIDTKLISENDNTSKRELDEIDNRKHKKDKKNKKKREKYSKHDRYYSKEHRKYMEKSQDSEERQHKDDRHHKHEKHHKLKRNYDSDGRHRHDSGKRRKDDESSDERHRKRRKSEVDKNNITDSFSTPNVAADKEVVSTSDDVVYLPSPESNNFNPKDAEPTSTVVGTPIEPEPYEDILDILIPESPATPPMTDTTSALLSPGIMDIDDDALSPTTPPLPDDERHTPPPSNIGGNTGTLHPVWRGAIKFQDVATFSAAAFEVSGKARYFSGDVPTSIDIVGRINPETVWRYITQMKKAGNKEILVIRFQPSSEEEKVSYIAMYCYLSAKKRYGVVGNCDKMVKDFYIVPLAAHQPIPQVLLPLNGPGFEESRPHMLIGVVIRWKHRRIYDTQSGVWIDEDPIPNKTKPSASESPLSNCGSLPDELDEESYTPPQESEPKDAESERSPSPLPTPKKSPSKAQFDMLAELNRQIEKDKEDISTMRKTFNKEMDDTPEETSDPKPMDTLEIKLPSNLQDILDNIKQKEVAIKDKELEIERRLNMETDESLVPDNPFGVDMPNKDVDLRLLLRQKQFESSQDQDLRNVDLITNNRQTSLLDISDDESNTNVTNLRDNKVHDNFSLSGRNISHSEYEHAGHPIMTPQMPMEEVRFGGRPSQIQMEEERFGGHPPQMPMDGGRFVGPPQIQMEEERFGGHPPQMPMEGGRFVGPPHMQMDEERFGCHPPQIPMEGGRFVGPPQMQMDGGRFIGPPQIPMEGGRFIGPPQIPMEGGRFIGPPQIPMEGGRFIGPPQIPMEGGRFIGPPQIPMEGGRFGGPPQMSMERDRFIDSRQMPMEDGRFLGPSQMPMGDGRFLGPPQMPMDSGRFGSPPQMPVDGMRFAGPPPMGSSHRPDSDHSRQFIPQNQPYGNNEPFRDSFIEGPNNFNAGGRSRFYRDNTDMDSLNNYPPHNQRRPPFNNSPQFPQVFGSHCTDSMPRLMDVEIKTSRESKSSKKSYKKNRR